MSTQPNANATTEPLTTDPADPFTYHVEAPEQGAKEYARCTGCKREILTDIGADKMLHTENCPHGDGF